MTIVKKIFYVGHRGSSLLSYLLGKQRSRGSKFEVSLGKQFLRPYLC
jgi:hypothetical protein